HYNWWEAHRVLRHPEPPPYPEDYLSSRSRGSVRRRRKDGAPKKLSLRDRFPRGLQVIFKVASIRLGPERPEYEGEAWHVEGTRAERICATALYYLEVENVAAPSRLCFRHEIDMDEVECIAANEYVSAERYLGVENEVSSLQYL